MHLLQNKTDGSRKDPSIHPQLSLFHHFCTYVPVLHKARRIIQSENNAALISLISWYEDYENILKERLFAKSNITPPYYWFVFLTLVKNDTTVRHPPNHH